MQTPKKGISDGNDDTGLHRLKLYVTGASPNSSRAITNVKFLLDEYLNGLYELEIIDVYQQPQVAQSVDIIVLPLLVREYPLPEKRLIGDMSDQDKVLKTLGISKDV